MSEIRVRFAPSPTGFLHVGGARTALFNWLFARKLGGKLVLRVEDTDIARERPEYREEIFRALSWLGIDHDEGPDVGGPYGPYTQRDRFERYAAALEKLRASGAVYPCFCASRAEDAVSQDDEPVQKSSRCECSLLPADELGKRAEAAGGTPALRMRIDQSKAHRVSDLIRGEVEFPPGEVEDFIVVKAGGDPLYNFACVVDDAAMKITHVIRGEEHLGNTPKQIAMYEALGEPLPRFAHMPIILNAERKKLSKRDGATGVSEYRRLGYLPDALVNFLALLGWSPGEDREIMDRAEMIERFDFARVQKHGAVFDPVKLTWMNGEYIRSADPAAIAASAIELLRDDPEAASLRIDQAHVEAVCVLLRERLKTVAELVHGTRYFFSTRSELAWEPEAVAKRAGTADARTRLREVCDELRAKFGEPDATWERGEIERVIRLLAERTAHKAGEYIAPLRVAITGVAVSAGIFETAEVLGRDLTLGRTEAFLAAHGMVPA